jgi:hypothetical protein
MSDCIDKVDPQEFQKRLDQLTQILTEIVVNADKLSTCRCPYKNRFDQCTAQFGCRNQRRSHEPGRPPLCAGDDKLDYRAAWETS